MKWRLLAVVALVLLAGCTSSGLEPSEAYEGSAAVNGATLHDTEDGLVLNVTLADTISIEIPWEDATYVYQFESEDGHQTEFQVTIEASSEGAEIVSAGYDDEI